MESANGDSATATMSPASATAAASNGNLTSSSGDDSPQVAAEINGVLRETTNGTSQPDTDPGASGSESCCDGDGHGLTPIAVVGMAMRLPGGVDCAENFWELLLNKQDGLCPIPESRFQHHMYGKNPSANPRNGYFLAEDPTYFDADFFSINKTDAAGLDPQQRLLFEVVWECLENGGQTSWRGKDIGCFVGAFSEDWLELSLKDMQNVASYHVPWTRDFTLANRLSYEFDLKGPSVTLKTACSASLVGLHEACQALYSGDCSAAVVAGVNLILSPTVSSTMLRNRVLASDGICKTFDAAADGYGRGEGVNAILVKRLDDAVRDGDPIRAVIKSTAVNGDGRTKALATSSPESQERLIRKAYKKAQIQDPSQTGVFECHGTGTPRGDTTETTAISKVFDRGIFIGATKPNVGHAEGASGITSLIKAVLELEHGVIPPNAHFNNPNPKIPFESAKLQVSMQPTPWPDGRLERVSVNSFGIGGANAHAILDSASSACPEGRNLNGSVDNISARLLLVSAKSTVSLQKRVDVLQKYVKSHPDRLRDLAYTLGVKREHLAYRAFVIADKQSGIGHTDFRKSQGAKFSGLTFVFTGQGAQWPGMGHGLMENFDTFRKDIRKMDKILQTLKDPPNWNIEDELAKPAESSQVDKAEFSQVLCTAVQIALVKLLSQWNIVPDSVVGHSSGEVAAAHAAGAIPLETAIAISYYRGQLMNQAPKTGSMAAVGLAKDDVLSHLEDGVIVACENSPQSVTLSGDVDGLDSTLARIKSSHPEALSRRLRVEMAYHSPHMKEIGESYESLVKSHITYNESMIPMYSTLTGEVVSDPGQLDANYWRQSLESPVLFYPAINALLATTEQNRVLVEIGPHSTLSGPIRQILKASNHDRNIQVEYVPSLLRGEDSVTSLLSTAGQLYLRQIPLNLSAIYGHGNVLTDLPPYPWQHDTMHRLENRITRMWRTGQFPHHELLGSRVLESTDQEPAWRNVVRIDDLPWIWDHKVGKDVVFPGAGYIAMAGEAMHQISGSDDYSIRNLIIRSPLVLYESKATEMVLSLKPVRLTDSLESNWFDFTISAYYKRAWNTCCTGQVRPGKAKEYVAKEIQPFPRRLQTESWYASLRDLGLDYGPAFRNLEGISANPVGHGAAALVNNDPDIHSGYSLHPTLIDQMFQVLGVAHCQGLPNRISKVGIPTMIEEIYVCKAGPRVSLEGGLPILDPYSKNGKAGGELIAVSGDDVVCSMKRITKFDLNFSDSTKKFDIPLASRIEWKPDIDFLPAIDQLSLTLARSPQMDIFLKTAILCMIEMGDQIQGSGFDSPNMERYERWANMNLDRIQDSYSLLPGPGKWDRIDTTSRDALLDELSATVRSSSSEPNPFLFVVQRILDTIHNKEPLLDSLTEDDVFSFMDEYASAWIDWNHFFSSIGHSNPSLNVIEVSARSGASTVAAISSLHSPEGAPLYSRYTFADASHKRVSKAKENFSKVGGLEFSVLDINQTPVDQGIEEGCYDLVIFSDMLGAVTDVGNALRNIRRLLAPGGRLLFRNRLPTITPVDYMMGPLAGWWSTAGTPESQYDSPEYWDKVLRDADFLGVELGPHGFGYPWDLKRKMLSRVPHPVSSTEKTINLLHGPNLDLWAKSVHRKFVQGGYTVNWCTLENPPPAVENVISLLDVEEAFFDDISEERYESFLQCFANFKGRVLWITRPSQMKCDDPRFGIIHGLARTLRYESMLEFGTFEIDNFNTTAVEALAKVYEKFQRLPSEASRGTDYEFALQNGKVYVGRFHWLSIDKQLAAPNCDVPKTLEVGTYGMLDSLRWKSKNIPAKLDPDQVEVKISHVGLNFRDVMVALGLIEKPEFGLEACGMISRVGSGVQNLHPGDRVVFSDTGLFSTRVVISAASCLPVPKGLSSEDATTLPIAYATAIHSLIDLGQLRKGQSVLIHAASGAVGQAAIGVCLEIGAEIYATVGSEHKVQYLMLALGIPRHRIFHSRDASFLPDLMRETDGRGVDIVLNSLSGELLHASWKCVAKCGKMIEIGKRDFMGHGKLEMDVFESNRAFFGVDLLQLAQDSPERFQRLCRQMNQILQRNKLRPIYPVKVFDAKDITDAFRYMQGGKHIGKILIKMPDEATDLPMVEKQRMTLSPEATYLLVGGFGGIGRAISTWMVENGARNLSILSRSAGQSPEDQSFIEALEAQSCNVVMARGDVTNMDDVERAIKISPKPIAGVIHMAMVLRAKVFFQSSHEDWTTVQAPKVQGAWNLHRALSSTKLDFFVVTSSVASICGNKGQANYAAANSFLDAFVKYRRSQGLPASVVNFGPVGDIGCIPQVPGYLRVARDSGIRLLNENEVLDAFQVAISQSKVHSSTAEPPGMGQVIAGMNSTRPLSDPTVRCMWLPKDARYGLYANIEPAAGQSNWGGSTSASDELRRYISEFRNDPGNADETRFEELLLSETVKMFSHQAVDGIDLAEIANMAVDSLIMVELNSWLRRNLDIEIKLADMVNVNTWGGLAKLLIEYLRAADASEEPGKEGI